MKKKVFYGIIMISACLTFNLVSVAQDTIIRINPAKAVGKVNPMIFGNNFEAANGKDIFSKKDTGEPLDGQGLWNPATSKPVPETVAIAKEIRMGMLRYPGGCLTHNFDWHKAVGAKNDRTYYKFGIDEYIELCRTIGAEPLMNVSEICTPKDAADLVEYLNMPATREYPWAMKRAEWGHKEPYAVKYFEMANESDHGNHDAKPTLKLSASEYSAWYLACAEAMRQKDKNILIGGHGGTGTPVSDPWNATVLKLAGPQMDFFAVHTYVVRGQPKECDTPMRACMASVDQVTAKLADYRALVKQQTGKDIPLAVTEFNASFVQEKPVPFRFSYGAALFCADYMREMMKPENNVAFACYWQFLNGYWGYIKSKTIDNKTQITTRAAWPVFKLIGQHTGTELLDCEVINSPKLEFEGFSETLPAKHNSHKEKKFIRNVDYTLENVNHAKYNVNVTGKDSMEIIAKGVNKQLYHNFKSFPIQPFTGYALSFEMKITKEKGTITPGLGLCDARGWDATNSACGIEGRSSDSDWIPLETSIIALSTARGMFPVLRLIGADDFYGKIEFRNIKISEVDPESFPPYSTLTAFATRTADPKVIQIIVINKHHASDTKVHVKMDGIMSAKLWSVSSPDLAAITNTPDGAFERVSGEPVKDIGKNGFNLMVPARSINALEVILQ